MDPPLLNSATPWATTIDDIRDLYDCPYTGAITICRSTATISKDGRSEGLRNESSSLNTLGYSQTPLDDYFENPYVCYDPPDEVAQCYASISQVQSLIQRMDPGIILMIEINLSCPNILGKPPPGYDAGSLAEYLTTLARERETGPGPVLAGIKTPPYTYQCQYDDLLSALKISTELPGGCPISFITATNTLGSCLVIGPNGTPALGSASGEGIGGMAGSALHPLALGNVATIRKMLDTNETLKRIAIIGMGGVSDRAGYERMRSVGATAVGVGTALGRGGVGVFEKIGRSDR